MTITLAIAGKGGTGKTTFAALTIKYLIEQGLTPVLAIDGDPSSNLNLVLGLPLYETVGQMREDTKTQVAEGTFRAGIAKPDWFDYKVNACLVEGEGVDLLAMGRPEGPGCYCAANNMLRRCIDSLGNQYPYVVIDNEAGMEHISRQTTRNIDVLFVISDPSYRGLAAAQHIAELTRSLGTRIGRSYLILNGVMGELPASFTEQLEALDLPLLGTLPRDPAVGQLDLEARPLIELDASSRIYPIVQDLLKRTLEH